VRCFHLYLSAFTVVDVVVVVDDDDNNKIVVKATHGQEK